MWIGVHPERDAGQVVGESNVRRPLNRHRVERRPNHRLGFAGPMSTAEAINETGQVVGYSEWVGVP